MIYKIRGDYRELTSGTISTKKYSVELLPTGRKKHGRNLIVKGKKGGSYCRLTDRLQAQEEYHILSHLLKSKGRGAVDRELDTWSFASSDKKYTHSVTIEIAMEIYSNSERKPKAAKIRKALSLVMGAMSEKDYLRICGAASIYTNEEG